MVIPNMQRYVTVEIAHNAKFSENWLKYGDILQDPKRMLFF